MAVSRSEPSKVPAVNAHFWGVTIMCAMVGLSTTNLFMANYDAGLVNTLAVMTILLALSLTAQLCLTGYLAVVYWFAIALTSTVGALLAKVLAFGLGLSSPIAAACLLIFLVGAAGLWCAVTGTLAMDSVTTLRTEAFYWFTAVFAFALGSAADAAVTARLGSICISAALFGGMTVGVLAVAQHLTGRTGLTTFWTMLVLSHPLITSVESIATQPWAFAGLSAGIDIALLLLIAATTVLIGQRHSRRRDAHPPAAHADRVVVSRRALEQPANV